MTQTLTTETFTNEQLRDIVDGAMLTQLQDKIMARELLANREAQPVAIGEVRLGMQDSVGCYPDARVVCLHDQADWDNFTDGTKLFTAPPAPVVNPELTREPVVQFVIPGKVSCEGFDPKDWVEARNLGQCEGWNACRAAMLAAAPEGGK